MERKSVFEWARSLRGDQISSVEVPTTTEGNVRSRQPNILSGKRRSLFGMSLMSASTAATMVLGSSMIAPAIAGDSVGLQAYKMGIQAYQNGEYGVALDVWRRYAYAGDVRSMKALGDYYSGTPVINTSGRRVDPAKQNDPNNIQALKWYTLAAYHDFQEEFRKPTAYERNAQIEASDRLPIIRERMTVADVRKAERLVSDTFERGSPRDIFHAAQMFQRGAGVKKSNVRAYKLYLVASKRGVQEAAPALENLRANKLITKKGIEIATEAARVWQPPLPEEHTGDTKQMAELKRLKKELEEIQMRDALDAVSDIDVKVLQHALRALGFYFGAIDNKMGRETEDAIRRFQYSRVVDDKEMTAEEKRNVEVGVLSATDTVDLIATAAEKANNDIAQYTYGIMHFRGIGVGQNGDEAVKWLQKAADQNLAEAHYALGVIFRNGSTGLNSVSPNKTKAALHFAKAAALGYKPAQQALELLEFEPRSVE
ncbi:MAG: peptidoglycan-binding protein [Pseudomonadota bacterium]